MYHEARGRLAVRTSHSDDFHPPTGKAVLRIKYDRFKEMTVWFDGREQSARYQLFYDFAWIHTAKYTAATTIRKSFSIISYNVFIMTSTILFSNDVS